MASVKMKKITKVDDEKINFLKTKVPKTLLVLNAFCAVLYFIVLAFWFKKSNPVLFWLLLVGEVFHLWQLLTYIFTIWDTERMPPRDDNFAEPVDVFITVCGEPVDIVEETVRAALAIDYPSFSIYILNDGYVAKKDNWREIEMLAVRYGVECLTREVPGGAKAGNINNALRIAKNKFVAIFDADHVPHKDFLFKMMGYFADPKMGYVQSPQFYKNYALNAVTEGAWEQQALFFGPICKGKNRMNAVSMCGTNMVIRKEALLKVGGMCEESIAEDFVTGMFIHELGYLSCYVPEVLAEGLAPEDFLSYSKQQFRWARGSMDVIFKYNLLFRKGLTFGQKLQYLSSVSFFLSGNVVILNALIPVIFFFTGLVPLEISTMALAAIFLPYIFLTLFILQLSSNCSFTFGSLAFAMAGFNIHIKALWASITGQKSNFQVTPKRQQQGNFLNLVVPHIVYILIVSVGFCFAVWRQGLNPSILTNLAWALLNMGIFLEFIRAAMPTPPVMQTELPRLSHKLPKSMKIAPMN